ncbi:MAG: hypothetical protein A4E29_01548 [Methanomassiliicoccales archaeon PtaB.Bin134]|nr:MAG: hypothetical protein A4E29_01548 [Methanomassiliicoccales archaeon PtaB.Bin134]
MALPYSPFHARWKASSTSGRKAAMRSLGSPCLRIIRSGTPITARRHSVQSSRRSSSRRELSVNTTPPSREAAASSKAPVTDTPASMEARAFMRSTSMTSIRSPRASRVARMTALAAALLLFSPLDTGICEPVRTVAFRLTENRSSTWPTQSSTSADGSSGSPSNTASTPSPGDSSTSAQVCRSTPTAQPLPAAMAFTTVTAPQASPRPIKAAPPGRPCPSLRGPRPFRSTSRKRPGPGISACPCRSPPPRSSARPPPAAGSPGDCTRCP